MFVAVWGTALQFFSLPHCKAAVLGRGKSSPNIACPTQPDFLPLLCRRSAAWEGLFLVFFQSHPESEMQELEISHYFCSLGLLPPPGSCALLRKQCLFISMEARRQRAQQCQLIERILSYKALFFNVGTSIRCAFSLAMNKSPFCAMLVQNLHQWRLQGLRAPDVM